MNPLDEAKKWLEKQKAMIEQQKMFSYIAVGVLIWAMLSRGKR